MLWELGRAGGSVLLGDQHGRTHLVRVISGDFRPDDLRRPVRVESLAAVRRGVSDLTVPVIRQVEQETTGLRVRCTFAEGTWFVQR
jgi:hypothetical protein